MIYKGHCVNPSLTLPITSEWHLFLVNQHYVIFHSGASGKTLSAQVASVRSTLLVYHLFTGIKCQLDQKWAILNRYAPHAIENIKSYSKEAIDG